MGKVQGKATGKVQGKEQCAKWTVLHYPRLTLLCWNSTYDRGKGTKCPRQKRLVTLSLSPLKFSKQPPARHCSGKGTRGRTGLALEQGKVSYQGETAYYYFVPIQREGREWGGKEERAIVHTQQRTEQSVAEFENHVLFRLNWNNRKRTFRVHFGTVPSVVESLLRLPTGTSNISVVESLLRLPTAFFNRRLEVDLYRNYSNSLQNISTLEKDGCNWQTYGSWVLKAISEDGLIGHLDGSETRPTTPKLPQEYGAGWTPRTNEERDVVTAWKTADNVWHQWATMAHQFIIYGLPDSILMLCMHLDTPREAFAYFEHHYGQIPRPEIQKTVDEAVQQHDMPSEQYMTGESAQSTCDSDNEPGNSPGGHEDPVDSPNNCAETKSGFLTPKTKVMDAWHVEPHLLVVEVRAMDSKWLDEGMDAAKAPDEGSQRAGDEVKEDEDLPQMSSEALETRGDLPFTTCERTETQTGHRKPENKVVDMRQVVDVLPMFEVGSTGQAWYDKHVKELEASDEGGQCASNEVAESRDLPEMSCKALDPVDSIVGQTGGHPTEHIPQMPIEENQRTQTHSETIANVPDPPSTPTELSTPHVEHSRLQNRPSARVRSATSMGTNLSRTRRSSKWQEMKHLKLDCKQASQHLHEIYQGRSACETPPDEAQGKGVPSSPRVGWGNSTMAGSTATKLEIRGISTNTVEMQGTLPHWDMTPKEPDKEIDGRYNNTVSRDVTNLRSITALLNDRQHQHSECETKQLDDSPAPPPTGTYYNPKSSKGLRHRARFKSNAENESRQAKQPMAIRNLAIWDNLSGKEDNGSGRHGDAARSGYTDSHGVEESPLTDSGGQYSKYEAKQPRHSPAPPVPSPNGILDMPTLFTDLHRHGRIKQMAENVSNTHMRQGAYRARAALMRPLTPLIAPSKRSLDPAGGLWMINIHYKEIRTGILMRLQQILSNLPRRFRNIANTYWREGVPSGSMRNDAKWPRNLRTAKQLPRSSGTRRDNEYRAERPNHSPAPPKRPPNGIIYTPSILRDSHRCSRIKTKAENISRSKVRGRKASILTIPIPPPRELARPLWNVANTYWRHGIPPGQTQDVVIRLLFDTTPQRQ
ncbi:hypothetical protein F5141DRAFT_1249226 [Pisolithus sp. B1]|nr:hypothetical protein F5141DRAFT_1249226 [Pisolithus sp. B1]